VDFRVPFVSDPVKPSVQGDLFPQYRQIESLGSYALESKELQSQARLCHMPTPGLPARFRDGTLHLIARGRGRRRAQFPARCRLGWGIVASSPQAT
jgi:hypothetical protein